MTQEQKELLLKDLCARLPYNPMVEYKGETYNVLGIAHGRLVLCKPFMSHTLDEHPLVKEVKPYLFPLSDMTKEHRKEISEILKDININHPPYGLVNPNGCDALLTTVTMQGAALIEFYNKHHYDYNGLIPMDLAIDATELNIY